MNLIVKVLINVAKKCQDNNRNDNNKQLPNNNNNNNKSVKIIERQEHDYILPYDPNKPEKWKYVKRL